MSDNRQQKNAEMVEEMLNDFSFSPKDFCKCFERIAHRTMQQSFTRLCIEWLKTCASDDYHYDGRNEASHEVAKKLMTNEEDINLPFI